MNSSLNSTDTTFSNMMVLTGVGGAGINAQNCDSMYFKKTTFTNNNGNDIFSIATDFTILESNFSGRGKKAKDSSFIYAEQTSVYIDGTVMSDSHGPGNRGIRCKNCKSLTIANNTFYRLYSTPPSTPGYEGAAINIYESKNICFDAGNFFSNLESDKGPALFVYNSDV